MTKFRIYGIERLKDSILDNPVIYDFIRKITDSRNLTLGIVKEELNLNGSEKILDVGCGIGNFSQIINSDYVGIDLNRDFIKFAEKKYGNINKKFMVMDAKIMNQFENKSFDKSIFVSMLHHFSDNDAISVLEEIARVTRKYLVIVDLLPTKRLLVNFLYKIDKGSFIRTKEKQCNLVMNYFNIESFDWYDASLSKHSLIICKPLE